MKKNLVRIVALLLVAMLALTLIPMGALAASDSMTSTGGSSGPGVFDGSIQNIYFDEVEPEYFQDELHSDAPDFFPIEADKSVTIKTSDYEKLMELWGDLYELDGLFFSPASPKSSTIKMYDSIKVPGFGTSKWDPKYSHLYLGYVPHSHKLSYWYSDSTTHWRECLICKHYDEFDEDFMYQNWHTDGDEDRVCDVCGADIPYHEVAVIETEGGKITVNEVEAPHRRKIVANVEAAEGYTFKKLHFTKVRDDGSTQEITRYKNADGYWTYMPTYKLEVSAEFVKK